MCIMSGYSTFPRTLFILFLHFRLYTRGVMSCTDESTCSTVFLEPAKCHNEGILSKCCLSCEKILRGKEAKMDRKTSFEDNTKPLHQHVKLHPETLGTFKNSMETEHKEKARPVSTSATTYLRILSTSDVNERLEITQTKPFSDIYHEKQVAIYIGVNVALVFLMIIAIIGFAIWKKAHRSGRHETFQVIERRDTPVPPPRSISSKENKKSKNRSSNDTYDFICDVVDKDIDNSGCQHDEPPRNVFDNDQTDRTYIEFIGEESVGFVSSTCIPFRSGSQPEPSSVTVTTKDNHLLPKKSCLPHTREHDELKT